MDVMPRPKLTIKARLERAMTAEYVSPTELALLLSFSPKTIYRKLERGEIPGASRYGRSWRIRRAVALAWHAKHGTTRDN